MADAHDEPVALITGASSGIGETTARRFAAGGFDIVAGPVAHRQRLLLEKEDADGMALDAEGTLRITGFQSGRLIRVGADDSLLPPMETSARAITQTRFGGTDLWDCYLTTVPPDGGESLEEGVLPNGHRSLLYRCRSEVLGMAVPTARFNLDWSPANPGCVRTAKPATHSH